MSCCRSSPCNFTTVVASCVQIEADPDYDLMASLGSMPQLRGSRPHPPPPSEEELAAELEEMRGQALASGLVIGGGLHGFVGACDLCIVPAWQHGWPASPLPTREPASTCSHLCT
jgi:hypothetical protein